MAIGLRRLLKGTIKKVLTSQLTIVLGSIFPMFGYQTKSLNGGELSNAILAVGEGNLDEENEAFWLWIVILLKICRGSLNLLSVG